MKTTTKPARITIELDQDADAAYIRLSAESVETTIELTDDVLVDLDAMRVVVGIEVLSLDADIPFSRLVTECHVRSDVVDMLRRIRPSVKGFVISSAAEARSAATMVNGAGRSAVSA